MSNELWPSAKQAFLDAEISWDVAIIKVALLRGYVFNAAHQYVSDLGATVVAASAPLASTSATAGVADAGDVTFPTVNPGAAITAFALYQSSAVTGGADVASTAQRLIAYFDTAPGLPITPTGGSITLTWDSGLNRIFAL